MSFTFLDFWPFSVAVDDNVIVLVIQRTSVVDVDPLPRLDRFGNGLRVVAGALAAMSLSMFGQ